MPWNVVFVCGIAVLFYILLFLCQTFFFCRTLFTEKPRLFQLYTDSQSGICIWKCPWDKWNSWKWIKYCKWKFIKVFITYVYIVKQGKEISVYRFSVYYSQRWIVFTLLMTGKKHFTFIISTTCINIISLQQTFFSSYWDNTCIVLRSCSLLSTLIS